VKPLENAPVEDILTTCMNLLQSIDEKLFQFLDFMGGNDIGIVDVEVYVV